MSTLRTYLKRLKSIPARGRDYKVKVKKIGRNEDGHSILGYCDRYKKEICINVECPDEELLDTFLHEYFHAIWYESGLYSEDIPAWVEHIFLVNITHDLLLQRKQIIKLLQLEK